jgi:hypothetical protein
MNVRLSALDNTKADTATPSVWTWTPIIAIAAVVIALAATLSRPAMRERAEQLKAEQIDQENRALCERLGMPAGSERFAACAGVLSDVRKRHAERFAADMGAF